MKGGATRSPLREVDIHVDAAAAAAAAATSCHGDLMGLFFQRRVVLGVFWS